MRNISFIFYGALIFSAVLVGCGVKKTDTQVTPPITKNVVQNGNKSTLDSSKDGDVKNTQSKTESNTSQNNVKSTGDIKQKKEVTKNDAEQIIKKIKGELPQNNYLVFDHMQSENGREYFVVHGYEDVIDNPVTKQGHSATFGWYYVDKETGKAFNWDFADKKLIPMN